MNLKTLLLLITVTTILGLTTFSCGEDDSTSSNTAGTITIKDLSTSIIENTETDALIGTFEITEENISEAVTFTISEQSVDGAVAIDDDGNLLVADALAFDYETNTEITGTVLATAGSTEGTATFTITVTDMGVTVTTLAGDGTEGFADGNVTEAKFYLPFGADTDASGNLFITDQGNHRIRKITPDGTVTTYAGSGTEGFADGNATEAQFNTPTDVAVDADGNVYVSDYLNYRIRKISPDGKVTTLAGNGTPGSVDGNGSEAQFYSLRGIATDTQGNVYVSDNGTSTIRKISPLGEVTTLAGSGISGFTDGNGIEAQFYSPMGLTVDGDGNIYVADYLNNSIRKVTASGEVTTIAGSSTYGFVDGNGTEAQFYLPLGVTLDGEGNIYVTDSFNSSIRKINTSNEVTTIAGNGIPGFTNGNGSEAQFRTPNGIAIDIFGNMYITEYGNHSIRKIIEY